MYARSVLGLFLAALSAASAQNKPVTTNVQGKPAIPASLRRALDARASLFTKAAIDWTRTDFLGGEFDGQPLHHLSMFAKDQRADIYRGTDDGITAIAYPDPQDRSRFEYVHSQERLLLDQGTKTWWRTEGERIVADKAVEQDEPPFEFTEFLDVGLLPTPVLYRAYGGLLDGLEFVEFVERRTEGGHYIVDGELASGGRISWFIDPSKAWSVTKSRRIGESGELLYEAFTDYRRMGNTWFPTSVAFTNRSGETTTTVDILDADLDKPHLPDTLLPADVGIEPGMTVQVRGGEHDGKQMCVAPDSETLLTLKEAMEADKAGRIVRGPKMLAFAEQHHISLPDHDAWVQYTVKFMRDFRLDNEQSQKALIILRDSQALRKGIEAGKLQPERSKSRVQRVFDSLVRRLDRLPTRRQRIVGDVVRKRER